MTDRPRVEIVDQGRAGTVTYCEGEHRISLWWEFGLEPTLALVDGPRRAAFDSEYPWAAGRQAAIYDFIAHEVVRKRAPGHRTEIDLDLGSIRILRATEPRPRQAPVDLDALVMREPGALLGDLVRDMLGEAGAMPPRDDASPGGDEPSDGALRDGMRDHLSIATRLRSASLLHDRGLLDAAELARFVRRQIREISRPADGLQLALTLAERHDSPAMRQALLYASYNGTACAPDCARLLLRLARQGDDAVGGPTDALLARIDPHNSSRTRQAAFEELCARVGMTFEPDAD